MREECSSGSNPPPALSSALGPRSSQVSKSTGKHSSHPWLLMSFAKFLHSLLQIFIETDYFLKIKKGEKAQLPSTITFILQKLPENEGEKGRDKSKEREKTSKCI